MSHVAVTGASSGIGEAIARVGAKVSLDARREDKLRPIAQDIDDQQMAVHDLSDPEHACD